MNSNHVPAGYIEAPQSEEQQSSLIPRSENDDHALQEGELLWNSGICAIYDDIPICCLGCFCPCVLFGKNVELLEGKPWVGPCTIQFLLWSVVTLGCCILTEGTIVGLCASCVPCYACNYRKAIRIKYNLEDGPCGDVLTHFFCHLCANCQEHRELVARMPGGHAVDAVVPPSVQTMSASSSGKTSRPPPPSYDELQDLPK